MKVLVLVSLLVACGSSLPNYDYSKEPDPRSKELVLGVGDVIGVNVWDQKELNTEMTIRPDGTITMPLVGDLKASGQTPTELREMIKKSLGAFVKLGSAGNEVTVAVRAWKSYRFTIEGEVTKAGVFSAEQYVTVAEAIAMAGGLTRFARHDEIRLLRHDTKGNVRQIPLDWDAIASGRRQDMNIYVIAGDAIYVP
jgi:polysaccharide export outer membrane protein